LPGHKVVEPVRAYAKRRLPRGDETVTSAAKYQLIVAAEAAQAICNHIAARVAERAPASYGDCYFILEEQGIIEPDLARRLANMAKFRNLFSICVIS
jgi:uncharacterized protein YutE (UPF0331/DUF86 family)